MASDDKIEELIREIAVKHGIAVGRDDPILILQTINTRLMQDSQAAQQEILDRFKEELEAIAHRWGDDAKGKAERTLNAALAAINGVPVEAHLGRTVREVQRRYRAKVICLRGNHEDGWLRVASGGWPEFVVPRSNGCLATLRSYAGDGANDEMPRAEEWEALSKASFFPPGTIDWMNALPYYYEDDHAIYVHAGLVEKDGAFLHPDETENKALLLWLRTKSFFESYTGKRVVCGHTSTDSLPPELSTFTPDDPLDMWVNGSKSVYAIDTGCGKGGFLTCLELPALTVHESR